MKSVSLKDLYSIPLPNQKGHISFSEIKDWLECSYRHKLKHIEQIETFEDNVYNCFGDAIHAACEDYLKTRLMKPELALLKVYNYWDQFKFEEKALWMRRAKNILNEFPIWLNKTFPDWEFVDAEHRLMEEIPNSSHNIKFKGFIDAVIKHNGKYHLLDYKTSGINGWSDYKRKEEATLLQLVYYNIFWSKKNNVNPDDVSCSFILMNRETGLGAKVPFELFKINVSDAMRRRAFEIVENMLCAMKRKLAFKIIKDQRFSNCKFCPFNETEKCP